MGPGPAGPEADAEADEERGRVANVVGTLLDALCELEGVEAPPPPLPPGADEDCAKLVTGVFCEAEVALEAVCVLEVVTGGIPALDLVVDEAPEPGGVGWSSSSQSSSSPGVGVPLGSAVVLDSLVTALVGTVAVATVLEETWSLKAPPGTENEELELMVGVGWKGTTLVGVL